MGGYVEGNNNYFVKKVMNDPELSLLFLDWLKASTNDKKDFEFLQYEDGEVDIKDNREETTKKQNVVMKNK